MAGMPPMLIERANEILKQLEAKNVDDLSVNNQDEPKSGQHIKEAVKKVMPNEYKVLHELKDILFHRNIVKNM